MRNTLICLMLCLWVVGCSDPAKDITTTPAPSLQATPSQSPPSAQPGTLDPRTAQMWSRSCALCHVDGNAGAPRLGNHQEWQPRLAQGEAALLKHTVEGFNDMPPLGYCMACENKHFIDMIRFMSGAAGESP